MLLKLNYKLITPYVKISYVNWFINNEKEINLNLFFFSISNVSDEKDNSHKKKYKIDKVCNEKKNTIHELDDEFNILKSMV